MRLRDRGQADQAVAWMRMNFDYFPDSTFTWLVISFTQQNRGDSGAAIASVETALTLDPENVQLQERLELLNSL